MPITEIRESIEQDVHWMTQADGSGLGIVSRRIEIEPNRRHTLMSVDFMDDSIIIPSLAVDTTYEAMISTYPVLPTGMLIDGMLGRSPTGADDSLLFKQISTFDVNFGTFNTQRMPNNFLGAMPTYSWYTPQLYLTIFIHTRVPIPLETSTQVAVSFYMSVKDRKASDVEYGIGIIGEYDEAQSRRLMATGRTITNIDRWAGEHFPSWKFGGIRPEGMVKANTKMNFFLPGFMQGDAETMVDKADISAMVKEARTMVDFDAAFGEDSAIAAGSFSPDWLKFIDSYDFGFGTQRPQFPPDKKHDNGNTEML